MADSSGAARFQLNAPAGGVILTNDRGETFSWTGDVLTRESVVIDTERGTVTDLDGHQPLLRPLDRSSLPAHPARLQ